MLPPDEAPTAAQLLEQWRSGDTDARDRLMALLHDELRVIARRLMRHERQGHTLQPTAVVNEACLRLLGVKASPAETRAEFLGLTARVMRQVLVDHARRRDSGKRGGDRHQVSLTHADIAGEADSGVIDALDLDAALSKLAQLSPRQASVAELRYFAGLTIEETAEALGVGVTIVKDEWTVARLWLKAELASGRGE